MARERLTPEFFGGVLAEVPDQWLDTIPGDMSAEERRAAYKEFFLRRLAASSIFEQEVVHARSHHL
jgi:hypothetical protein